MFNTPPLNNKTIERTSTPINITPRSTLFDLPPNSHRDETTQTDKLVSNKSDESDSESESATKNESDTDSDAEKSVESEILDLASIRVIQEEVEEIQKGSSKFDVATFNRIIPGFDGNADNLKVFLSRCDSYNRTLTLKGQNQFLNHLIFKLSHRAFIIYEQKTLTTWVNLKKDLLAGIADKKSIATIQNELLSLRQFPGESVNGFLRKNPPETKKLVR